ncbi:MAG: ABC-F family ATP-binding cassette domain-containing protein [Bacteroidales bacterium]|nr:ABC-F family ATP-binding cassette domain-containing protein [Bacteroidales bacterium]
MISIEDVTVAYGGFVLLDKINFHVSESDKIGLVGKNGAGKSTILKMICGLQNPTSGRIDKPKDLTIGYLPQIMEHHRGRTVLEEAMTAFVNSAEIEREIASVTKELETRTDYESDDYAALIERLTSLSDRLEMSHSEPPEVQARRTLLGLGFLDDELGRLTETFSQGWNMRIELAKILLRQPDVLLLDEPTNHLDIESIEWLEDYLKARRCALLLVSHDRRFLDTVTNRTVEVMLGHVHDYKVPYTQYLELRAERIQQQVAAYENQQRMIQKTEEFINTFRYKPTKSNQVQSRIKALEKLDRIEIDETDNARLTVKFPPAPRSGDVVFKSTDLTVGYPQKVVFRHADIEIKRGEKVALIGRNGEGKTTLMRVLMGELDPIEGEARIGHNVQIGYYAQNQEDILDKNETVFSTLDHIAVGDIRSKLRDLLAQFLFRGEDIDKRVSVLSGGERARLGMAKLMLQSYNLLALDEPTNHMDIKSKEILKQALKAFDGTLLVVSHDRDFLDGLVDKMYEFRDGQVKEHLGTVSDFLSKRKLETLQELDRKFAPVSPAEAVARKEEEKKKAAFEERKQVNKIDRKKKNRISWLECEIAKLEEKMKQIEAVLAAPTEKDDIMELTRDYLECKRDLDAKTEEWGTLIE